MNREQKNDPKTLKVGQEKHQKMSHKSNSKIKHKIQSQFMTIQNGKDDQNNDN